jgi:hypothetical protein
VLGEQPVVPGGLKLTVAEKDMLPSRMPERYADYLNPAHPDCILDRKDVGAGDFLAWRYYAGRRDGEFNSANVVFLIATDPVAAAGMMDGLDGLDPDLVRRLKANHTGCPTTGSARKDGGAKSGSTPPTSKPSSGRCVKTCTRCSRTGRPRWSREGLPKAPLRCRGGGSFFSGRLLLRHGGKQGDQPLSNGGVRQHHVAHRRVG